VRLFPTKSRFFALLLLLVFLANSAPSLAISKTPYLGVSPLKAGHSNRIECNNNPVNYIDPAGLWPTPDTGWDAFNIGLGITSLGANLYMGNVAGAAEDALGLAIDATAAAIPGIPGGAGVAIKGKRAVNIADSAKDVVGTSKKLSGRPRAQDVSNPHGTIENSTNIINYQDNARKNVRRKMKEDPDIKEIGGSDAIIQSTKGTRGREKHTFRRFEGMDINDVLDELDPCD